jgi:hypothetical protein
MIISVGQQKPLRTGLELKKLFSGVRLASFTMSLLITEAKMALQIIRPTGMLAGTR